MLGPMLFDYKGVYPHIDTLKFTVTESGNYP